MCWALALPSVSVSVESGCWTEGQGAGPVKYWPAGVIINLPPTPDLLNWLLCLAASALLPLLTLTSNLQLCSVAVHLSLCVFSAALGLCLLCFSFSVLLCLLLCCSACHPLWQPAAPQTFGLILRKPAGHASKGEYSSWPDWFFYFFMYRIKMMYKKEKRWKKAGSKSELGFPNCIFLFQWKTARVWSHTFIFFSICKVWNMYMFYTVVTTFELDKVCKCSIF